MPTDEILEGRAESINQWQGAIEIYAEHAKFDGPRVVIILPARKTTKKHQARLITMLLSSQMWFVFEQNVFVARIIVFSLKGEREQFANCFTPE